MILEGFWERSGKPLEGWVWPAPNRSGHVEASKLRKQHNALTRLGESGCDAWTLARIAGHSSITISSRYVYPSEDAVLAAMSRLGGHKIGHSESATEEPAQQRLITQ